MGLLKSIFLTFRYWFLGRNYVRVIGSGKLIICKSVRILKSKIYVYPGATLIIHDNCDIKNTIISVTEGICHIGKNDIIDGVNISVDKGELKVGHHSKLACKRIWIRFGGILNIGDYTNINSGSELRCDESLNIGSYNQISYNVRIWDTNTHSILSASERRSVTESYFPYFGFETVRPTTAPVKIGDDCWIGEGAAILKGTSIGDRSIIGFGTLICAKEILSDSRVINERKLKITSIRQF